MKPLQYPLLIALSILLAACGGKATTKDGDDFFVPATNDNVTKDPFDRARLLQISLKN